MLSRRQVLALTGAVTTSLAGCASTSPSEPPPADIETPEDPDRHVFGATGEWATFGANAANNRVVSDGQAPVDGLTERWRVESGLGVQEPIVADDTVYHSHLKGPLDALNADDGSVRWSRQDVTSHPLVRGDTVYVATFDGLFALDTTDGTVRWQWTPEQRGWATALTMVESHWLFVAVGEHVYGIDTETGEVRWSRRLFGDVVGAASAMLYFVVVATEAGKVYLLEPDGTGYATFTLPSTPRTPPVSDREASYVRCADGTVYRINHDLETDRTVDWSAETGLSDGGMAVHGDVYAVGGDGLTALDVDTGERQWSYETGPATRTAPVFARGTLFVGGDALYALDPEPSSGVLSQGGPALRHSTEFYGAVGPGPVLDDGRLYTVAETAKHQWELFAFDAA